MVYLPIPIHTYKHGDKTMVEPRIIEDLYSLVAEAAGALSEVYEAHEAELHDARGDNIRLACQAVHFARKRLTTELQNVRAAKVTEASWKN